MCAVAVQAEMSGGKSSWWRYDIETFLVLLVLYEGNPPVTLQRANNAGKTFSLMLA